MSNPVTLLYVLPLAFCWSSSGFAQNCPTFDTCPNNVVAICDETNNDPVFWNAPPFTEHPGLGAADLPEASAMLSAATKPGACVGAFTFKYALFLDLNGDNLMESVITSDQSLPAGRMLFGNALNAGFGGPDTLTFDNRPVPDSVKFRFALETVTNGGVSTAILRWHTAAEPGVYITPRLPHGRHLIRWTIEKNGQVQAVCETVFRVKDCMAPEMTCHGGWGVSMPANDTLVLNAADCLEFADDNITPDSLLQFSLRRAGTGMGFPVDANGHPIGQLTFTCPELGFQGVEVWVRDLAGNTTTCAAGITLFDDQDNCVSTEPPVVCATTIFAGNDTLRHVQYTLNIQVEQGLPPVQLTVTRLADGCVRLPDLSAYLIDEVAIIPDKNDDPLNGVSTFDLVLINRHILGTQLFSQAWQHLAADANNSATLTTFDIIELRKLILGIYDSLPSCRSWKFMQANCVLDSLLPLQSICPGVVGFSPDHIPSELSFWGIKTGDVSGNASADSLAPAPKDRQPNTMLLPDQVFDAGETFDIPLRSQSPIDWVACQWALQWDTSLLALDAVLPGGFSDYATAEPRPGVCTFVWFDDAAPWIFPDEPLCTLRVRAKAPVRLSNALQLWPAQLQPEAYDDDGTSFPLQLEFAQSPTAQSNGSIFPPQPNPASEGIVRFPVRLAGATVTRLEIFSATGTFVYGIEDVFPAGSGALEWPVDANTPAGMYTWRIQSGDLARTGKLVRF